MPSFKPYYRKIFETFGYPVTKRSQLSTQALAAGEQRLGVRLPAALRDYYLVAGRDRRFNFCNDRLLSPREWQVDQKRLVFLVENQACWWWGVSIRNPASADPPVSQGVEGDPFEWSRHCRRCSEFLGHKLHCQAVYGGLPFRGRGELPEKFDYRFEANGWTSYGEIEDVQAYSRPQQVVCLERYRDPFAGRVRVTVKAGAKTKDGLRALSRELGVALKK